MNFDKSTLNRLDEFSKLGKESINGTTLIGRAPHIAPMAWLHTIYRPLTEENINALEKKLDSKIPDIYKSFLMASNGLNIFNTTLSLYGMRESYDRNADINLFQPFDICTPNLEEKPINANSDIFIIGSYDWDGSYIYINKNDGRVYLTDRDSINPWFSWSDFNQMLDNEINRLILLHDSNGKELVEDVSTLPDINSKAGDDI